MYLIRYFVIAAEFKFKKLKMIRKLIKVKKKKIIKSLERNNFLKKM
jgi:hypothetical protein